MCFSFLIPCCEGAQVCTRVCVLRPEDNLRSRLQELFPPPLRFFIGLNFTERHSPISAYPELGLQHASLFFFFNLGSGDEMHIRILARQALYQVSHFSST